MRYFETSSGEERGRQSRSFASSIMERMWAASGVGGVGRPHQEDRVPRSLVGLGRLAEVVIRASATATPLLAEAEGGGEPVLATRLDGWAAAAEKPKWQTMSASRTLRNLSKMQRSHSLAEGFLGRSNALSSRPPGATSRTERAVASDRGRRRANLLRPDRWTPQRPP